MNPSPPAKCVYWLVFISLLAASRIELQATSLYTTTFPGPPYLQNQAWAGLDGWLGVNTGNAQDDVIIDVGAGNLGGHLGTDNANQSNVLSVYRDVPYDPIAQGEPIVTLSLKVGFFRSSNGHHDRFSIAFFNQAVQILGELVVEPDTGSVLYFDGIQNIDTGLDVALSAFLDMVITIDFEQNTWSTTIDGFPFFTNVEFLNSALTRDLNIGSFDFRWTPTAPMNSGDNFMVVDDIAFSANPRVSPDAAPTLSSKRTVKTKKRKAIVKGSATDDRSVVSVQYRGKKGGYKTAKGTVKWKFKAKRLKRGTNRFFVRAVDSAGQTSAPKIIKVKRR